MDYYFSQGVDVVLAGIATHYVPSDKLEAVTNELLSENSNVDAVLKPYLPENVKQEFSLAPHIELINECFSATSVEAIIKRYLSVELELHDPTEKIVIKLYNYIIGSKKRTRNLHKTSLNRYKKCRQLH